MQSQPLIETTSVFTTIPPTAGLVLSQYFLRVIVPVAGQDPTQGTPEGQQSPRVQV